MNVSGSEILMFGGWTKWSSSKAAHKIKPEATEYFQIWSTETMSWNLGQYVGSPPSARYGHTATAIGPHLLIFGGWDYSNSINEIIVLREFTGDKSL
jgi:Rab9 effector protein with kelch motifs